MLLILSLSNYILGSNIIGFCVYLSISYLQLNRELDLPTKIVEFKTGTIDSLLGLSLVLGLGKMYDVISPKYEGCGSLISGN